MKDRSVGAKVKSTTSDGPEERVPAQLLPFIWDRCQRLALGRNLWVAWKDVAGIAAQGIAGGHQGGRITCRRAYQGMSAARGTAVGKIAS